MNYYTITTSTETKVIGSKWPQCKGLPDSVEYNKEKLLTLLHSIENDVFPTSDEEFIFELEEKAKLTDFVSPSNISAIGLLISSNVKSILDNFNLDNHRYYKVKLFYKGKEFEYYWLHFVKTDYGGVNFKETSFYRSESSLSKDEILIFNDYNELKNYSNKHNTSFIYINYLVLDLNLDCFYLPVHRGIFISKKLKDTLESKKITGYEVHENLNKYLIM